MLELDPKKRATLDEIWQDEWIRTSPYCRQEEDGRVIHAEGHKHVLEGQPSQESKTKTGKSGVKDGK